MVRKRRGLLLAILGVLLFVISLLLLLYFSDLYFSGLLIMFIGVVLIGMGTALAKEIDASLELPRDDCYYCGGAGKIGSGVEMETCPRCGGTGLARKDD
jgi:membrane protein implicated in regulation of membrane protease activity